MTLVERLAELRRHLDHLLALRPRVPNAGRLRGDLSLHNDVLFSLQMVCQLVIDIAGELSARRGLRFEDYRTAIGNLASMDDFPAELVTELERLPGFRNVLIHAYVDLDLDLVVRALDRLAPIERFASIVRDLSERTSEQERETVQYDLDEIMERLERHRQAATYGAVAGLVGEIARGLMRRRPRSHRGSWIVAARDHHPTAYSQDELHPDLVHSIQEKGVLDDSEQLAVWLVTHP